MHSLRKRTLVAFPIWPLLLATPALAQYTSDFEALVLAPSISVPYAPDLWDAAVVPPPITPGQDNYYWPDGTDSVPYRAQVYTAGAVIPLINDYGIADNPTGSGQFIAGEGPGPDPTGTLFFARAQRDMGFTCDAGPWTFASDICCTYTGQLPAANNLGSLSAQPFPGGQSFIMLARWTDAATAANWDADYVWFDASGAQLLESVADPAFQNLMVNHWYRWETVVDLTSNRILEVRLTDLTAGTTVTNEPVDRYMEGGTAGSAPPTGFRFFTGSATPGNVLAWDNPSITPTGYVRELPGCGANPADSLSVGGAPTLGNALTFDIDAPAGIVTPGMSLGALGISLTGAPGLPCGSPLGPGITGNLLIGLPPGASLLSLVPWAGPGMPVGFVFPLPANTPANCIFVGQNVFAQGALLDLMTGQVMATTGARVTIGG